jgi:hypothetical protein
MISAQSYTSADGMYHPIQIKYLVDYLSEYIDTILWPIASSTLMTIYGWISVSIYFSVVLLITVLLCGIQLVTFSYE